VTRLSSVSTWLLCAALLALPGLLRAETAEEIFDGGNLAYADDRFSDAVEAYETVLKFRVQDPRLEYNLGNAQFRLGNLGLAILHFERARRLDPTDRDILDNLAYARSFCFDIVPAEEIPAALAWARRLQDGVGPDRQAWASVALLWGVIGVLTWGLFRSGRWTPGHGWALGAGLLLLAATVGSWSMTETRLAGTALAVVLDEAVEVRAGPGTNNPTLFTVHEGLTVEVRDEREDWILVRLPDGLNGWARVGALGRV